jgi:hypothetical protein
MARRIVKNVEPETSNSNRRRGALGLGAVAGLVAVVGVAISLAHPPGKTAVQSPFNGPVTGLGFSVAYDTAANQVVLFGGLNSPENTWLWDGHHWTLAKPRTSPAGRSGAAAAYDPVSRTVMLFGGSLGPGMSANDTWAWDGTTWHELDISGGTRPLAGSGAEMAWDAAKNEMVLVTEALTANAAETWTWGATGWARQPQGDLAVSVYGDVMAYDPTSHSLLLVSLQSQDSTDSTDSVAFRWDGSTWQMVNDGGPAITGMALNPQLNTVLACGVATYSPSLVVQDSCWEWLTDGWFELQAAVPPEDSLQLMVEDEVTDTGHARILMFGWLTRAIPGQPQPLHIWSWDGEVWKLLA